MENASTLHGLVFDQAGRTPDAIAIDDGSTTTYGELREQAERVASALRAHGVGRGDFVGICVGRSAELLAVVLGVLASGAAYVPLDPAYPKERLRFMTTDCRARVVVCDESFANFYDSELFDSALLNEARITLLSPKVLLQRQTQPAQSASVEPEDLAYLLYTSGSTGQPKGVMIRHCNAVNLARWARDAFSDEDRSRILFSTSLSWDLSIFEIFASLAWGGTLVVVNNALTLAEVGTELGVTLVNTSPSVMSRLIHHRPLPDSVRVVTLAGEILHRELVERLYQRSESLRVWNLYGPTETTTFSTGGLVDRSETSSPAIGQPLLNTSLYLLDEQMQPVEAGQVGEIWIGGEGVAAGYLHRPKLTAEVFVPDPFGEEPKGNLYRTGDQARSRADGSVIVLGRLDHQVKLRGLRIELGEIDAQFLQQQDVGEAVTVVSQIGTTEPKLVAYLVAGQGCEIDEEQVRTAVAQNLPPHMVPALIEVLDQLPLSPNGKIDRAALPAPGAGSASEENHASSSALIGSAALGTTEQEIAHIFGELLGVTAPLSAQADFFDCGGDSLGALQLVDLIAERLQVEIPLSTMFEESQVGQIAAFIDESEAGEAGPESRPAGMYALRSAGSKLPLFLGPLGNGGLRGYRKLIAQLDPDRPVYGMQAPGVDGELDPYRTVEEMGRHFAAEIAAFQPVGPILLGGFSYGGISAIEAAQQLQRAGREIALVVLLDTSPFSRRVPWTVAPRLRLRQGRDSALDTLADGGVRELIRRRGYRFVVRTRRIVRRGFAVPKPAGSAQRTEHIQAVHQQAVNSYRSSEISFPVAVIAAATAAAKDPATRAEDPRSLAHWQVRLVDCPGVAHRDFLSEPTASQVAAELDSVIESAVLESAVTRSAVR